ncbi:Histidinol-phosphate/aromatic aminotransferase or cobyric acid decarboxylase [Fibrobacter sp. UWH5]|uniref:pyridoxal phosphate-dependent aminotransferase n=1 Tax=Fibrobacter sp. UWH5 TaxID=1896211 RepID=UPI000915C829|nr:pyridoxal phosphate-dependent aminotransferase [Fibrobacter sp. UWH5]SHL04540.1 Histidinol-phosphate/aromatic aminotransferase or cobyric acid decarboxylase [Fibrobacter sp. UWH5]
MDAKLEKANEALLKEFYNRYGGFWRFPEMLDYCYLVNPYFNRSKIIAEMQEFFPILVSEYPSGMSVNSKLASECWNVNPDFIIPGNGAAELIKVLMENINGIMGIVRPTFEEYPNRLTENRVVTFVSDNRDFRYTADDLIDFFERHPVDSLLLINPDNPSGNFISYEGLLKIADWCENKNIRFVLDESFVDFSDGYEHNTFIRNDLLEKFPHMAVMKSISKSYGIPGLRLGILCSADKSLIAKMKKQVSIWNINSFAEFFMQIFPKYRDDYKKACDQFIRTRNDFEIELKKISFIRVMPSQANFFFLEVLPPYKPKQLCAMLLKDYNILASACLAKKGIEPDKYMRIAIRSHGDNEKFIVAMRNIERGL